MASPLRNSLSRRVDQPTLGLALLGCLLASCAIAPSNMPVGLETSRPNFSNGRVTFELVDEYGIALPGMRVDLSWDEPSFYKTSAMTNRQGSVTFSGVPQVAEVTVDHPGGRVVQTLLVPQSGRADLRMLLDTQGGGAEMRERERARLEPPQPPPAMTPAPR